MFGIYNPLDTAMAYFQSIFTLAHTIVKPVQMVLDYRDMYNPFLRHLH